MYILYNGMTSTLKIFKLNQVKFKYTTMISIEQSEINLIYV